MDGPSHSGEASNRPKSRIKSFSGCWTCRARHLKCDEGRPVCDRCQRARRRCEGYGLRLSWTSIRGPSNFSSRTSRRSRQPPAFQAYTSELSMSNTAPIPETKNTRRDEEPAGNAESPACSTHRDSVASSNSNRFPSPTEERRMSEAGAVPETLTTPILDGNNDAQDSSELFDSQPQSQSHCQSRSATPRTQSNSEHPSSITLDGTGSLSFTSLQNPLPRLPHIFELPPRTAGTPAIDNSWSQSNFAASTSRTTGLSKARHLDHLPNPGLRGQLVEHWVVFLCDALNPMPGIHNPLRTIFMPIALEGARADFKACTGATALFHLICATSAFHLLQTRSKIASQQELEKAALEHYNLGITHISQNIQSDDGTQSVAVLASLITCILNEAVMIPTPFWRLHMKGAVEWVKQVDPQVWHQTEAASTVYQMFVGIATLIQSQLLLSDEHANIWEFQPDSAFGHRPYILGHVLGLPQSLLQGIAAINTFYRQTKDPSCHHLVQDQWTETADRIELEVYLSAPTRASLPGTDEDSELMYHHAYTYYFATLIYMKRVVKDVPLEEIQDLVDHSLSHLESLSTRSRPVFSPLLWPIAIIAFDTDREASQQRILNCVTKLAERSRLTVWASLAKWAQDMWVLRKSEGNQNLKWHHSFFLSDNDNLMMI